MIFASRGTVLFFVVLVSFGLMLIQGCQKKQELIQDLEMGAESQDNPVKYFAETITIEELKDHISYLASDEMEGRESGTPGAKLAAQYIAEHMQNLHLKGIQMETQTYLQRFPMVKKKPVDCFLESAHGRVDNWDEFMEMHGDFYGEKDVDLVFVGYGRDMDYEEVDVKNKLVAFFMGKPDADEISNDWEREKIVSAMSRGAVGTLLIVHDDEKILEYIRQIKPYFNKPRHYQDKSPQEASNVERSIVIPTTAVAKLFGLKPDALRAEKKKAKNGKSEAGKFQVKVRMKTSYKTLDTIPAENVLGYIEGSDKKEECLIFTAHYDHLGKSGETIYNGAYDNAAGVAAVMEIAEAFVLASEGGNNPKRSVLFLTPDAEEIGGVGSIYYLDHPVFPLSETIVDINIDGIGREDANRPGLKDFVHVYLSKNGRADLKIMKDRAVERLVSDLRLEWRESYSGSDNAFFERDMIPAIALGTGQPKDHHKSSDTADKIDYKNVQQIAQLAFAMAWEIANNENSIRRIISE
ncbi:MAG: M28 family peptidase [Candidatus Aminicenantes bacterium]|nr:MAG: M28 family peptidase [Candidatus Aminicenantes bacterium]